MSKRNKLVCKVVYTPGQSAHTIEVIGEVDEYQLKSPEYNTITVKNRQYLNNRLHSHKFFIDKCEVREIIVYEQAKRLIIDKKKIAFHSKVVNSLHVEN